MRTQRSKEDYLEAILMLGNEGGAVRAVDVAEHLHYSKPSVSRAVSILAAEGMIWLDEDKFIHLTKAGRLLAGKVYEKHLFFKEMLMRAGVDEAAAAENACLIEHAISNEAFDKIKLAYLKNHDEMPGILAE